MTAMGAFHARAEDIPHSAPTPTAADRGRGCGMLGNAGQASTMIHTLLLILLATGLAAGDARLAGCFPQWDVHAPHHWNHDDVAAMQQKARFAAAQGVDGMMVWTLSGDDGAGASIRALRPRPIAGDQAGDEAR